MTQNRRRTPLLRTAAGVLLATATLAACDAPTAPGERAVAGGPSMLITPACAGTGGQTHPVASITTAQTWTRANSPHRVTGSITVNGAGRLTIQPGAVVCFEPGTGLTATAGGKLSVRGRDTAQVVLTARDPAQGWRGISLYDAPAGYSYLTNVRMEHVALGFAAIHSTHQHGAWVDSAVIRQSGQAASLYGTGSRLVRSRVDSTTNRNLAAVVLGTGARFEKSTVRGAAWTGVVVDGEEVVLLGGRIEGSGGPGLVAFDRGVNRYSTAVRVVGGRDYAAVMSLAAMARMYPTSALLDSLDGNARDTVILAGGLLKGGQITAGPQVAFKIVGSVEVDSAATFNALPGASLVFAPHVVLLARAGGRVVARGTAAAPVRFTADDPAQGWNGITLHSPTAVTSYLTNVRIEHVSLAGTAVAAYDGHRVLVDSSVIRQSGRAASIWSANSRFSRTRVDTTLYSAHPAVELGSNVRLESTRILAAAGPGLSIWSGTVQVVSCEVRDGDQDGIVMQYSHVAVHNCNLVNNGGVGIRHYGPTSASATGNWWGSTGGPSGPGGDGASGALVVSPWRTTPYVLPYLP
jgi:hypothetical protein